MISFTKRERAQHAAAVVGVDADKFTLTLDVRPRGQPDSRPHTFPTTRGAFDEAVAFIRQAATGAPPEATLVGIEFAGSYGFTFARYLAELGFPLVGVAHTSRALPQARRGSDNPTEVRLRAASDVTPDRAGPVLATLRNPP